MANDYFQFKQFTVHQDKCAMKVTTDACLFGAWIADEITNGPNKPMQLLDAGTGTGLLSLMIAQKNSNVSIDAVEIDKEACTQATENIARSPWPAQVNTVDGDVRQLSTDKLYDIIVSNPPFYENELTSADAKKNLAHHSSELSLEDLLDFITTHLEPTGTFFLLMPYKRKDEIGKLIRAQPLEIKRVVYVRQSATHDFSRIMIAGGKEKPSGIIEKEMAIANEDRQYTDEFVKYLQDYYLYL